MSSIESKVSWRLNELLTAGKKAKEFAQSQWDTDEKEQTNQFEIFEPKLLEGTEVESDAIVEEESPVEPELESSSYLDDAAAELGGDIPEDVSQISPTFSRQSLEQAIEAAEAAAYEKGVQEGKARWEEHSLNLQTIANFLDESSRDTAEYFAPLKKLAIHIAEELVRGELSYSSDAISRLVAEAIGYVGDEKRPGTVVYLNPDDLAGLSECKSEWPEQLEFRPDINLTRGSIRTALNDEGVEDFLDNRLASLSQEMLELSGAYRLSSEKNEAPQESEESTIIEANVDSEKPDEL